MRRHHDKASLNFSLRDDNVSFISTCAFKMDKKPHGHSHGQTRSAVYYFWAGPFYIKNPLQCIEWLGDFSLLNTINFFFYFLSSSHDDDANNSSRLLAMCVYTPPSPPETPISAPNQQRKKKNVGLFVNERWSYSHSCFWTLKIFWHFGYKTCVSILTDFLLTTQNSFASQIFFYLLLFCQSFIRSSFYYYYRNIRAKRPSVGLFYE